MMVCAWRAGALGLLLLTPACGSLSSNIVSKPQKIDMIDVSQERLPDLVASIARPFIDDGTNVGLVIGVLDGEKTHVFGFGKMSASSNETPGGETIFAIGSVTKAFLSLEAYQLIHDGQLNVSDTLADLLPRKIVLSDAAAKITVGQLLTHSSGLPRQPNDFEMLVSLINYSFTGENIYRHVESKKVFALLRDFDPDKEEVGVYRYSNIGSGILALAIETKTGKSLDVLLKEGLLSRIGAKSTTFDLTAEQESRLATGHVGDSPYFVRRNTPMAQWDMGDILQGAAALYSTANDLLAFARYRIALGDADMEVTPIHGGLFSVSHQTIQKSSYGWMVDDFADPQAQLIFQHGMISGYSTYVGVEQSRKLGVVVLANNFNWDDYIGHSLLLALVEQATQRQAVP